MAMRSSSAFAATIRVGVGGWTYEPWRNNFYPARLPHSQELAYASRQLSAIEINSTYHGTQKATSFATWRDQTPDDFVFSVKASRFATNRRMLAEAGESIERFIHSGIVELGPKLGPIVWQFATSKVFDAADFDAFLHLLPRSIDGLPLRHAMDVRHDSFRCAEYLALARRHGVATVFTASDDYPEIADITGDFVYLRVMRTRADLPDGLTPAQADGLAECALLWRAGGEPAALPKVAREPVPSAPRDVFVFFISGAKEKAPAAAVSLRRRLQD